MMYLLHSMSDRTKRPGILSCRQIRGEDPPPVKREMKPTFRLSTLQKLPNILQQSVVQQDPELYIRPGLII